MSLKLGTNTISPVLIDNIINNQSNKTVTPSNSQQTVSVNDIIFEMPNYFRDGSGTEYKTFSAAGLSSSDTILITGWVGYESSGQIHQSWTNIRIQTLYTTQTFRQYANLSGCYITLETANNRLKIYTGDYTCYQLNMYKLNNYDGLDQVTVEPIPSDYIIPEGTLIISAPGIVNAKQYASVSIPGMTNPTWSAATVTSSTGIVNYGITLTTGFKSVSQSFSSSITLPSITGTTITPSETSQIAVNSYKWTKGSIIVNAIPNSIGIYKKIIDKTINIDEVNEFLSSQTSIPAAAFFSCSTLSGELNLNLVESISFSAFYNCSRITAINGPNVKTIGSNAFYYCSRVSSISFPELISVNGQWLSLGSSCSIIYLPKITSNPYLSYMYSVQVFDLPELTSIQGYAFYYANKAINFNLPKLNTMYYAYYAFGNCYSLSSLELPELSLIQGGYSIFQTCSILHTLSFPKLQKISNASNIIVNCPQLMSIYLMSTSMVQLTTSNIITNQSVPIINSALTGTFGSIFVPSSLLTTYQTDSMWSWFSNRIVGI